MNSVIVIIVSILILSMVIFMTLSSNSDYGDKNHKNDKKPKIIQLNDHSNHLFWFIQVFIMQYAYTKLHRTYLTIKSVKMIFLVA